MHTASQARIPLQKPQEPYVAGQRQDPDSSGYSVAQLAFYSAKSLSAELVQRATIQALREATSFHYYLTEDEQGHWWNTPATMDDSLFSYFDLSEENNPELAMRDYLHKDFAHPIHLYGPNSLFRSIVTKLGEDSYAWYMVVHHAVCDGYSGALIRLRVNELIAAELEGQPEPECRTLPFANLATATATNFTHESVEHWVDELNDIPRRIAFTERTAPPADLPMVRQFSFPRAKLEQAVGATTASWRDLAAALALSYIAAFTQQDQVVVGLPVARRHTEAAKRTYAQLATTLPLKVSFTHDETVLEIAGKFRANVKESYPYQDVVMGDLFDASPALFRRSRIYGPILNIIPFHPTMDYGELKTAFEIFSHGPADDLTFLIEPKDNTTIPFALMANPNIYTAQQCQDHCDRFQRWCTQLLENPQFPISQAEALTSREAQLHRELATTSPEANHSMPPQPEWGEEVAAEQLALLAQSFTDSAIEGIRIEGTGGRQVPTGEVGRVVALTSSGPIVTPLLAGLSTDSLVYHGEVSDQYEVGEFTVEKGMIVRALEHFATENFPAQEVDLSGVEVISSRGSLTASIPWELSSEQKKNLRAHLRAQTPARIRVHTQ